MTTEARKRLEKFLAEWNKRSANARTDLIYGLHAGDEREAELRASDLRTILSALDGQGGEGWVLVPRVPTAEMLRASLMREDPGDDGLSGSVWRAMIEARPLPPPPEVG